MTRKCFMYIGCAIVWMFTVQMAMAAAGAPPGEGMGLWTVVFLGFGAFIIMMQVVPAFVLLSMMLVGLFKKPAEEDTGAVPTDSAR